MTMPNERTRALRRAGEFLRGCSKRQLPDDLARRIQSILRHYPTTEEIEYGAEYGHKMGFGRWLLPEFPEDPWP